MLRSIRLFNWRSHQDTTIRFSAGANLFLGPMGSGKSSVVDALCFALYGTYPKLGRRDVTVDDVGNFRHAGQPVKVELEWDEDGRANAAGRKYKVIRNLSDSQAWLYSDGKLVQKGARAVSEEIETILQIPYELFSRAVYAEQNRLDHWLSLPAGPRKAELDRLLGLDKFETARKASGEMLNSLKEKAAAMEAAAPVEQIEEMKKGIETLGASVASREKGLGALASAHSALSASLSSSQKKHEEAERVMLKRQGLERERQRCLGTLKTLEQMLSSQPKDKAEEIKLGQNSLATQREKLESEFKQSQEQRQSFSHSIGQLEGQLKNEQAKASKALALKEKLASSLAAKSYDSLKSELAESQNRLQQSLSAQARLQASIEDEKKVLQALGVGIAPSEHGHPSAPVHPTPSASCPVCEQPLDEKSRERLQREHEKKLETLKSELAALLSSIRSARQSIDSLSVRDAEATRLSAQLASLAPEQDIQGTQRSLAEARASLEQANRRHQALSEQLQSLQARENELAQTLRKLADAAKWETQLANEKTSLKETDRQLAACPMPPEEWAQIKSERDALIRSHAQSSERLKSEQALLLAHKQALEQAVKSARLLEEKRAQALALRVQMDELGSFRSILLTTQAQMRSRVLEEINLALNRLWPLVYPYGDWSAVRLVGDEKDYSIQIHQGEWKALDAHASGGERACLALAVRAALSILLTPHLGWLILDEPTHNLDGEAVQSLGRALAERIPQVIPQVIVITHDMQLLESTPASVFRFCRDKKAGEDSLVESDG